MKDIYNYKTGFKVKSDNGEERILDITKYNSTHLKIESKDAKTTTVRLGENVLTLSSSRMKELQQLLADQTFVIRKTPKKNSEILGIHSLHRVMIITSEEGPYLLVREIVGDHKYPLSAHYNHEMWRRRWKEMQKHSRSVLDSIVPLATPDKIDRKPKNAPSAKWTLEKLCPWAHIYDDPDQISDDEYW